ncbi:hypothetical protein GCM10020331_032480 [Ectobacillus funiculus]
MELNNWLNRDMPEVAQKVGKRLIWIIFSRKRQSGLLVKRLSTRYCFICALHCFLGCTKNYPIDETRANILIGNRIRNAAVDLSNLIEKAFKNECAMKYKTLVERRDRANEITIHLINKLPEIRETLNTDIEAAYNGDPAALNTEEILLSYPSIEAISIYRIAHVLYEMHVPLIPRMMSEYAHQLTGIDIHPGAEIGESFFIDHGTGVVIGETCIIGKNVKKISRCDTWSKKSFPLDENGNPIKGIKRHPEIEEGVVIYAGATILGGDTVVGHDSTIGGAMFGSLILFHRFSQVYNSQPSPTITQSVPK